MTADKPAHALLFKVSAPRDDWVFSPRPFWHNEDWSFSDDRAHPEVPGLIEEDVLFAGRFDDVNLHLLPGVWRLRVWLDDDERRQRLDGLGYHPGPGVKAVIFAHESDRSAIESFTATVFSFDPDGFERTPSDEFVSRSPQRAVAAEQVAVKDAMERWRFDVVYVSDTAALEASLRGAGIDHQIQGPATAS